MVYSGIFWNQRISFTVSNFLNTCPLIIMYINGPTVPVAENYDFPSDVTNCRREDRFFPEVILIVLISDV